MSDEMIPLVTVMLWDVRAQMETQLRRVADAQRHWEASHNGTEATSVARVLACADEIIDANRTIREASTELRGELLRIAPQGV